MVIAIADEKLRIQFKTHYITLKKTWNRQRGRVKKKKKLKFQNNHHHMTIVMNENKIIMWREMSLPQSIHNSFGERNDENN